MSGSIHLIAYPDWRRSAVQLWHDGMFQDTGTDHPQVALFAAPGGDDPEEIRWITACFKRRYSAAVHPVRLIRKKTPLEEAQEIIRKSDLLYFTGGAHFVLVRAARAAGIEESLRRRFAEGAVVGGYSAGAIAIGAHWPDWPDPERPDLPEEGAELVTCLGLNTKVICDFHAEEDNWEELYACLRLLHAKNSNMVWHGYGVPTRGAIRISREGRIELLGDKGPWLAAGRSGIHKIQPPDRL